jgi:hypothetical protein
MNPNLEYLSLNLKDPESGSKLDPSLLNLQRIKPNVDMNEEWRFI